MTIAIEVHLPADQAAAMKADVRAGLTATPKELSPKYFYDERGSQLFEAITELEEYYPTRRERQILVERSTEIVAAAGNPATLIELGSGSASKTRHLLDAMRDAGSLKTYVPVDISEEITRETATALVAEYPGLDVHGLVCDFEAHLERTPTTTEAGPRLIAFLGGTVGNLYPDERAAFLSRIANLLDPTDHLLLGTDLVKDPDRLELAYDDPAGVTAEFNKNVLCVLNRELAGDFDLATFEHLAHWDAEHEWIDIGLRSLLDQDVHLADLDLTVHFDAGEILRTEISTKFTRPRLEESYAGTGLTMTDWFTDPADDYALSLAKLA
ncbi:MAG TPA: L-histidine N(alpha)-methyltransferase [Solirubrobacterales bacterium]|jgi:L-histidine N-alpha-methyltransferase|nr:L-histidine N(alpha)-methyltransferase [Solirubrobacterales bacterium]